MSTEAILVSVVAPTHHRVATLTLLLNSLNAQTLDHSRFEVIIVGDDGDPGAAVVAQFAQRTDIKVCFASVPNDPWHGRSPALKRNYGAELASGAWLAFIDDDCVADPDWLDGALPFFSDARHGGVEGKKVIPALSPPTLTYRGLLLFTRPGGYQTANMFYRRGVFLDVGGFDTAFPFYLEDTDLAWSVLDRGYQIPHADRAVVQHPVPKAEPQRLLATAARGALMPYLYKKHRDRFRASGLRTLARGHLPYLLIYLTAGIAAMVGRPTYALFISLSVVPMSLAHSVKLFWGCRFTPHEAMLTTVLLPVVPLVTFVQLMRGNLKQGTLLLR